MKKISAAAINALKEALGQIYWYKLDLKSFLLASISDHNLLSRINWDEYKINIAGNLITYMQLHEETYHKDLLYLISEVVKVTDFSHLERLTDGKEKARKAKKAVSALSKISKPFLEKQNEQEEIEKRRKKYYEETLKKNELITKLDNIKKLYFELFKSSDFQKRGFQLEKVTKDIFELFDLDPKASFRLVGEQIDGAFSFDGTDFLFEAKWTKKFIAIDALDTFSLKISRKLENTLGLYLSINGFSDDAIKAHSAGRKLMILMDGSDLMAVLDGRIDLPELLYRKKRHASQTGEIYLKINEVLNNGN